jgi:hypothetical protein
MINATTVLAAALHAASDQAARKDGKPTYWQGLAPEQQEVLSRAAAFLVSYVGTTRVTSLDPSKVAEALARAGHTVTSDAVVAALQVYPTVNADAH